MRPILMRGCVAGVLLATFSARAQIVPVTQMRSVQVSASDTYTYRNPQTGVVTHGSDNPSDSKVAPDFAPFESSLMVAAPEFGRASADQTSSTTPTIISAVGHAVASGGYYGGNYFSGSGGGYGSSSFSLVFDLSSASDVEIDGTLMYRSPTSLQLTGPNGFIFNPMPSSSPFTWTDELPSGRYTIEARASAAVFGDPPNGGVGSDSESFQFTLKVVPEPQLCAAMGAIEIAMRRRTRFY